MTNPKSESGKELQLNQVHLTQSEFQSLADSVRLHVRILRQSETVVLIAGEPDEIKTVKRQIGLSL
jgi:hypothetical protein